MLRPASYFDLQCCSFAALFRDCAEVWQALARLATYIAAELHQLGAAVLPPGSGIPLSEPLIFHEGRLVQKGGPWQVVPEDIWKGGLMVRGKNGVLPGASVVMAGATLIGEGISLGKGVLVEPGALIKGPTMLGDYTEVRQAAYLRGNCLIGRQCVVGHATELKQAIFLDGAKAGHFAYVGDSILGRDVNLGAGTKCANFRFFPGTVKISMGEKRLDSGLRKLGAILGERVQTGCNSVCSPGVLIGPESFVLPNVTVACGIYPRGSRLR